MNERLLFFIFMPIVFEGIMFLLNFFRGGWADGEVKKQLGFFSVLLLVDYIIEVIYLKVVKGILGVWVFSDEFVSIESHGTYEFFVFCSVVYIIICIIASFIDFDDDELPIMHTIILIICFIAFSTTNTITLHESIDEAVFNSMEYQVHEDTIYLRAMGDGHTTTGSVHGSSVLGTGYIQGKIADNYNLYYSFVDSNGETVIQSLVYNNDSVNIYEEGESCTPRIVFKKYHKSYETEHNSFYNEYYIYDIYIPSMIDGVKIDME